MRIACVGQPDFIQGWEWGGGGEGRQGEGEESGDPE